MDLNTFKLIRVLAGIEAGRECRSCREPIDARDAFGMSEGVCVPCRAAAGS